MGYGARMYWYSPQISCKKFVYCLFIFPFRTWRKSWFVPQHSNLSSLRTVTLCSTCLRGQEAVVCPRARPALTSCCPSRPPTAPAAQAVTLEAPALRGNRTHTPLGVLRAAASPAPCQTRGETPSPASLPTAAQATVWPPARDPARGLAPGARWSLSLHWFATLQQEVGDTVIAIQTVDVPPPVKAQALGRWVGAGSPSPTAVPADTRHHLWRDMKWWWRSWKRSWGSETWSSNSSGKTWMRTKQPSARWDTIILSHEQTSFKMSIKAFDVMLGQKTISQVSFIPFWFGRCMKRSSDGVKERWRSWDRAVQSR